MISFLYIFLKRAGGAQEGSVNENTFTCSSSSWIIIINDSFIISQMNNKE